MAAASCTRIPDVDLLILLPQAPSADDEAAIERLVAALWDLGLEPGHSVRTIEDCQREAGPTSRWKPRCWNRAGWRAAAR